MNVNHELVDAGSVSALISSLRPETKRLSFMESAKMDKPTMLALFAALATCQWIAELCFHKTAIGNDDDKARALSEMLARLPNLRTLMLLGNQLETRLDWVLGSCFHLTSLSICDNTITPDALDVLLVNVPFSHLQHLQLFRNQIETEGSVQLALALPTFTSLREFEFSGNFLGKQGAYAFAQSLPQCAWLETFQVNNDQLGGDPFQQFMLHHSFSKLTGRLGLGTNQLMSNCGGALSRMLCTSSLTELDVSHNHLGDVGVQVLCKALPKCQLRVLIVSSNRLTSPGISSLAKSMQRSKLVALDVSFNEFGNVGGQSLLRAIKSPTCRVSQLRHHCNRLSSNLASALDLALEGENRKRILIIMRSAQQISRLGKHSFANAFPKDLCRMLQAML
ncbi:hypothetical protein BASA81_005776 [Batrachochytrium salamandrivorans]|nr:hypothetical protein BASA81_005776 [Batrachochytrium salamandrivorans]